MNLILVTAYNGKKFEDGLSSGMKIRDMFLNSLVGPRLSYGFHPGDQTIKIVICIQPLPEINGGRGFSE